MTELDRTANVLGALAGTISDQAAAAMAGAAGLPARGSTAPLAALSAIAEFLDSPTVDQVGQVLGLSPSGAVRLVDRLAADGLVTRGPGPDGRTRAVTLTADGRAAAAAVTRARRDLLTRMLDGFAAADLAVLEPLLGRLMRNAVLAKAGGAWICRLCDLTACERSAGRCPALTAARERADRAADPPGGD
ncbi:MarR family winged helix-turn-helix transcriptional regulator [Nakamurella sp.]|uniref:MarR family winged helix-turn-helix transcriptional regulator n=1 Tax=Nakamurella sp. TaxID=1869182 RepID=UPI003B3A52E4